MVNAAGLEETTWLLFRAHSSVTEAETSGGKRAVTDLLVRGLVTSFTCVAAVSVVGLWGSEDVDCLVVLWVFTVFDIRSLIPVMAGVLMELLSPTGLCVDE